MRSKLIDIRKFNYKFIRSNFDRYLLSALITIAYAFALKASIFLLPILIVLFFSINSLINSMYTNKNKIVKLEEVRDFEYSIIISQASDDDILSSIEYYLDHYKANRDLYITIEKLYINLCNNGNLEKNIEVLKTDKELKSFLKVLCYTLSSGMDIKKVAILEYEALIKRIEAEKEIWASFSDKRLEIIIMILIPPFIIFISKIGMASNLQGKQMQDLIISSITILLISFSCKIIEKIIGGDK